jgi:hypothetical protein
MFGDGKTSKLGVHGLLAKESLLICMLDRRTLVATAILPGRPRKLRRQETFQQNRDKYSGSRVLTSTVLVPRQLLIGRGLP